MLYKYVLKPVLFRFDPEFVHDMFISFGEFLGRIALGRWLISLAYGYHGPDISKTVDGITYPTPILLAAGFDYNGRLTRILPNIGLGGEEVGSVTARPCAGNPRPRLTRLPRSGSIIVNKGLKNEGVDKVVERLKKLRAPVLHVGEDALRARLARARGISQQRNIRASESTCCTGARSDRFIVGISIARTNDEQSATVEAGIEDYAYSFRRLNEEGVGDFYTINISCPNSFGGETFATPELLDRLLARLREIPCSRPVYVKMPINTPWAQFEILLKIIDNHKLQGVVIGNLNKDYASLDVRDEAPESYRGGLSGRPCSRLSTELIRKTRELYGKRFTIIGVGGVMSPEDARDKFAAGADLIQLITGMIYEGPGLIQKLNAIR